MSGPHHPPLTAPVLDPLIASLSALQSQFAALQEELSGIKSDVGDVLIQLDTLRKAQNTTCTTVDRLEDLIGVPADARSKARATQRRVGGATAGEPDPKTAPEKTLLQSLTSIQSTVNELLARESRASSSLETLPSSMPGQKCCRTSPSIMDPSQHHPKSQSTQPAPTNVHSKEHVGMSIQAHSSIPGPSYSLPRNWGCVPWFSPVYWNHNPSTPGLSATNSMRPTAHTPEYLAQFLRDTHHPGTQNIITHGHAPRGDNVHLLPGSTTQYNQLFPPTISVLPGASSSLCISVTPPALGGPLPATESSVSSTRPSIRSFSEEHLSEDGGEISATVVAENDELTSCLPTPQSETSIDDQGPQIVGRLMHDRNDTIDSIHVQDFPVIPTPPCRTLEPPGGDRGPRRESDIQGPQDSPLTPQSSSFHSGASSLLKEGDSDTSRQVEARKAIGRHPDPTVDARFTVVGGGDAVEGLNADEQSKKPVEKSTVGMSSGMLVSPVTVDADDSNDNDARSSLQTGRTDFTYVAGSGAPVATIERELQSIAASVGDSSQIATGDVDLPITPTSLGGHTDNESSEHRPNTNGIGPTFFPMGGRGLGSTSSTQHPLFLTSATPSRYTTAPGSPDPRFTQDEEEVWSALIDMSEVSTPVLDDASPAMLSQPLARLSSVRPHIPKQYSASAPTHAGAAGVDHTSFTLVPGSLAVVPSVLHDPPTRSDVSESRSSPAIGSLSPLTSLDDSDDEPLATPVDREPSSNAPTGGARARESSNCERRCSEPYRPGSRLSGGPSAPLNELAVLARRKPLKIHIMVPEGFQRLKRKRDAVEGEMGRGSSTDETAIPVEDVSQRGQAELASGSIMPDRIGEGPSASTMATQRTRESSSTSGLVDTANEFPEGSPVPRKKKKKRSKHLETKVHETLWTSEDQQKARRIPESKRKSQEMFHFRLGQIVSIDWGQEHKHEVQHQPQAPVTPPVSQSPTRNDEFDHDSRTPTQVCHNNQEMKTPLSSSVSLPRLNLPSASIVELSPSKQDECDATWPELPSLFSQWHMQFIQCDNCDNWYHYACVGIESGDQRLEPEVSFTCPACYTESAERQTPWDRENTCARPDCPEPHLTGDSGHFFVEKLVGLKRVEGYVYLWLAKWEGYPMTEATWIPKENMDGDGTKLCNAFLEDAKREGADLSRDVILLKEAIQAGWEM